MIWDFFCYEFAKCLLAVAVYGGALSSVMAERKRERSVWRRERKRKEKAVGPVTVINWDLHKFSPDLNPT